PGTDPMATWRVELAPAATRQLKRAGADELVALRGVILALAEDRRPPGVRKVRGSDLWRVGIRIDGAPWRVAYQLRTPERLVVVVRVVRRDEATYRQL
ncbi:MAG: type II toxin-antitoxin system RelE family toxin, partial [Candidatus Limnocylindria bacterium]